MMEAAKFHQPQEPKKQIVLLSLSPKVSKPLKLPMQSMFSVKAKPAGEPRDSRE